MLAYASGIDCARLLAMLGSRSPSHDRLFGRPYLGVHYPSDVVAGALLGWAVETLS